MAQPRFVSFGLDFHPSLPQSFWAEAFVFFELLDLDRVQIVVWIMAARKECIVCRVMTG